MRRAVAPWYTTFVTFRVRSGLEVLVEERPRLCRGRKVGLLCHPASVDADLRHASDLIRERGADLRCLFGPEHGVRGEAQYMVGVGSGVDPQLGIPVHSLYGSSAESLRPGRECLQELDAVLVDLQDVGSRYYTYVWTMKLMLEACVEQGVEVVVLDRPNPLGGLTIEGPTIEEGYASFVGLHPVPVRHGLTAGEMARLLCRELGLELCLEVVRMKGWKREHLFDDTGLPWVLPSPNMPSMDTALVYCGGCLLEGTNLSEGRGTTRPFELVGAPWVDGVQLTRALHDLDLPGVRFRPTSFRPTFDKYAHQVCEGLQIHVTDRKVFRSLLTGVALLHCVRQLWPDNFAWREDPYEFVTDRPAIDLLAGGPWLRQGLEQRLSLGELSGNWSAEESAFARRCEPDLQYPVQRQG